MKTINHIFILICLCCAGSLSALGQSDTIHTTASDFFFQLDTSRIPTGFLKDKAVGAGETFRSSTGSGSEQPELGPYAVLDNYWLLRESAVKPNTLLPAMGLLDSAQAWLAQQGKYPLVIFDFDYNYIDSNAIDNGLLSVSNDVLVDGPDFSQSPYQTGHFLNASVLDSFMLTNATFSFEPGFYFSNTGQTVCRSILGMAKVCGMFLSAKT